MLPASGPIAMPLSWPANSNENARPRRSAGTAAPTSANEATWTAPAPAPCAARSSDVSTRSGV